MPYGYDVAQSQVPITESPLTAITNGATQGLNIGMGFQKARREAQVGQLQRQMAKQEMDMKKQS